jgi:hypothetical protein
MKWNEYTNTWNKKPNDPDIWNKKPEIEERLDVSKVEITKIIIHSIGIDGIPIHKVITDIKKVSHND